MPPGYSLEVTPQRKYKYRSLWNVRVFRDGPNGELERVYGRAWYNVAAGIREAQRWAWDRSRVTVDYVSYGACAICGRDTDSSSVGVSGMGVVCAACYEKAD